MTTRELTAETTGPVTIDASLTGHGGVISVRAVDDCQRATLTITTTDEEGPAAEAVRTATLSPSATGLRADVQGAGNASQTTVMTGGQRGVTIVQTAGDVHGEMIGFQGSFIGGNFVGGDMVVNGVRFTGGDRGATIIQGSAPIKITAVVPVGSSVITRTQTASVETAGALMNIDANTQTGSVRIADHVSRVTANTQSGVIAVTRAADITAKTVSGDVHLGTTDVAKVKTTSGDITIRDFGGTARLQSVSGAIEVKALAGGDIDAHTVSGDIDIIASQAAMDDNLDVRPRSVTGRINVPSRRASDSVRRRR